MSTFVEGVDHIVQCPPKRENSKLSNPDNFPSRPISSLSAYSKSTPHEEYEDDDEDFVS